MSHNQSNYEEDPSQEVSINLSNTNRKYQSSKIIVQDTRKSGLLSFLMRNPATPTQESPNINDDKGYRPTQSNTSSNT